jgi:hypothetical protein
MVLQLLEESNMPMLYRHKNGTYTVSMYDPEGPSKTLTKEQGEDLLRKLVPEPYLSEILADEQEGFCLT